MTKDDLFHRWYVNLNVTIPPVLEESKAFDKISFFKHLHNKIVYRDDEEGGNYYTFADGFDHDDEEEDNYHDDDSFDYDELNEFVDSGSDDDSNEDGFDNDDDGDDDGDDDDDGEDDDGDYSNENDSMDYDEDVDDFEDDDLCWDDLVMVFALWNGDNVVFEDYLQGALLRHNMRHGSFYSYLIPVDDTKPFHIRAYLFRLDTSQSCPILDEPFTLTDWCWSARSDLPLGLTKIYTMNGVRPMARFYVRDDTTEDGKPGRFIYHFRIVGASVSTVKVLKYLKGWN